MDWFTNSKHNEAKKLILHLADAAKRDHAAQDLIKLGSEAVPALMEALQTQDMGLLAIYKHLLARMPSASQELLKAMQTAHPLIRARVADVFAISKEKAAIPILFEALHGEFFTVRARAALALSAMGEARALPELLPLLKDHEVEVRIAACQAVGFYKDPSTFDELANVALDDPKLEVRQAAVQALGNSKHQAAVPFLMEALRDSFWWFENEKAVTVLLTAIENMGGPIVEPLIAALGDREKTVRKYAVVLLGRLHDAQAMDELGMALYDLHDEVSRAAADSLAQFGSPAIEFLADALVHPETAVRTHAVIGLGKIKDERVVPFLIEMLQDPDRIVQKQALSSLFATQDPRAVPAFQQVAANRADREMASLAKEALAKWPSKS